MIERKFIFQDNLLIGDVSSSIAKPSLLVLHGSGKGSRHRFLPLRLALAQHSIVSVAFDCLGHGDTGGTLEGTTLKKRTEQALAVIEQAGRSEPFSVLGSSMGAYTAVKLCEHLSIENLILFVPAMYSAAAYEIPFGAKFSTCIQAPNSWHQSDAWRILSDFRGNIVIVRAANDEVIPKGVIDRIKEASLNAASLVEHTVADAPHGLANFLAERPGQLQEVAELIIKAVAQKA